MKFKYYISIIIGVLFSATLLAQKNIETSIIVSKLRVIRSNLEDLSITDQRVTEKANTLRLSINDMILRIEHARKLFPMAYGRALDQMALESGGLGSLNTNDQITELNYLLKDLTLKFKDRTNTLGEQIYNSSVPLTIIWNKGKPSASKYRVRYSGAGYKFDAKKPSGMLGSMTNPVKASLIAGIYKIWLTKADDYAVIQMWEDEISPEKENIVEFDVP